jgi:glucose-6-phosphate isomerase
MLRPREFVASDSWEAMASETRASMDRLRLELDGADLAQHGVGAADLAEMGGRLESLRDEIFEQDLPSHARGEVPEQKQPLDTAFVDLPQRMLDVYQQQRARSELGRILAIARRLADQVDRVLVLGIGGSYMGARALMEACSHPYHNALSRAERGGYPRLYFEGNNLDNDAIQGLLDLLVPHNSWRSVDERWALIPISKSGGTLETAVALRIFMQALQRCCPESEQLAQHIVPITGEGGKLWQWAQALGCREWLPVPDGVGGRFSVFSAVGLLPAAVLGIDIVALLNGAADATSRFRQASLDDNVALQFAGIGHLMETRRQANVRVMSVWAKGLEATGLWYDQLLAESLGKQQLGVTPLTAVNTRDLHSRAQQHQQGRYDKLLVNVQVDRWRADELTVPRSERDDDGLNDLAGRSVPQIMQAAIQGVDEALRSDLRPAITLRLPTLDAYAMGQLMQTLMLATVVEGRLLQVNPYGQPGVEAYKRNMNRILGRG